MNTKIVEQISVRDRILGKLCFEAENSYKQDNYFSALVCLFVLEEQIIKFSVNKIDSNFHKKIIKAQEKKLIDYSKYQFLNPLKDMRNKIFHESHFRTDLEIENKF